MAKAVTELRPLMTRIPEKLRARLARAAKRQDRSMNAEINYRLESSFSFEDAFGSPEMKDIAIQMSVAFDSAGAGAAYSKGLKGDWVADPACYRAAMFGVIRTLMLRNGEAMLDLNEAMLEVENLKGALATQIIRRKVRGE